jgi:DIL domain
MFVFQESELGRILDIAITKMTPQRSPSQKPIPANIIFLASRYAHYHAGTELLEMLLRTAMEKINDVVERNQWDMTILAFWISNATLLLYYLKKDTGLSAVTADFQVGLADLINEIFVLIIRDAERRMDKVLEPGILDHETIPGFEDVTFQNEWKIFKRKKTVIPEPMEKRYRPPSPRRRAQIAPRNITSLLSSTLFVLDLYDIHSVIIAQVLSQLFYWLGAEIFNRILENRKYLARTKAMQIRMNISTLEDWARQNNRQPDHYEKGSMTSTGENIMEAARRHLAPAIQLLQWLQCFSSLGDDFDALIGTIQQLPRLSPQQLQHSAKYYRAEVGEKGLPKTAMKYLANLQKEKAERRAQERKAADIPWPSPQPQAHEPPATPTKNDGKDTKDIKVHKSAPPTEPPPLSPTSPMPLEWLEEQDAPENLFVDPSFMLPFILPSSTDMLVTFGAGFGGTNRERERKYIPTVPPEFLSKLDPPSGTRNGQSIYDQYG